jgi:hypothetical protein
LIFAARQRIQREGVHVKLGDRIAFADEAQELPLGRLERGVRHHVQQTDVQFTNILLVRRVSVQYPQAFLFQLDEGG